jgi:hypothetical protein
MSKRVSDEAFIELWRTHQMASRVSEATGIPVNMVYQRRRNLEMKYAIKLESKGDNAKLNAHLHTAHTHAARIHLGIENGVGLVFSDAHFHPGLRTTAYDGLIWAIREFKPSFIVCNGDAFDGASISRHPRIGWDNKPSVIQELKACEIALGEIEDEAKGARRNVRLTWPLGNHCSRFESRLAANAPEFQGVKGFTLKDHFPAWTPCWSCWPTEDVVVKHRYKGGIHATHQNTVASGKTMVTGHLHSLKVTPYTDYGPTRYGVDTGTLADPGGPQFVDYMEDNPASWRSGFAILTFWRGMLLWPEVAHAFAPGLIQLRGQVIDVTGSRK